MQIPIGVSDFRELRNYKDPDAGQGYAYVDKSLLIKDILKDGAKVLLFTRPRRFGKTLNLSMLQYFFAQEVRGKPTKGLFTGLKISDYPNYMAYQGKYPVILISFKDVKATNFTTCMEQISSLIRETYKMHEQVIQSTKLSKDDLSYIDKILELKLKPSYLPNSLKTLMRILADHYQERPIILIDEYDTPLHEAYVHGYYENLIEFLRNLFSTTLKDNDLLQKAVLTGILRVSKESLFSGLSHLKIYSLLEKPYAEYFGFTEEETTKLLEQASLTYDLTQIKNWYNGYNFGGLTIYNPWSILQCIDEKGALKPYWVNTSGNELLKQLIIKSPSEVQENLERLLQGKTITGFVDEHIVFADLAESSACIWSLLLLSGYLKYIKATNEGHGYLCELTLPNKEVETIYISLIKSWLGGSRGRTWLSELLKDLLTGNIPPLQKKLQTLVLETLSHHDVTKTTQESFYHGLMLGFVASLQNDYLIQSNKEAGLGRYDIALIPKKPTHTGVVIELKAVKDKRKLASSAQQALKQITGSQYTTELKRLGIKNIKTIGIAFAGKTLKVSGN